MNPTASLPSLVRHIFSLLVLALLTRILLGMFPTPQTPSALLGLLFPGCTLQEQEPAAIHTAPAVDLNWYPPSQTAISNLSAALHGTGVHGFIFNTSTTADTGAGYGTYNYCNMPHVRAAEYPVPVVPASSNHSWSLVYVEVLHRHHKRTPYAANSFPVEAYPWDCDDEGLYYFGQPLANIPNASASAQTYWQAYTSPINPFKASGWRGSCQFPQITRGGLVDSRDHGADLYGVYHDLLDFLPFKNATSPRWPDVVRHRATQNVITSQVAGMLIGGMWNTTMPIPLGVAAASVDSLEPQYACPAGAALFAAITSTNSSNSSWAAHLTVAAPLYAALDAVSGVPPRETDLGFHASFDHYFDNLSARQCGGKPLPCQIENNNNNSSTTKPCINQTLADAVYRLGEWEYSWLYRGDPRSLRASVGSYGVWIAELAAHLREAVAHNSNDNKNDSKIRYFHNVAHDGSVSRVLSILQVDVMVWPGMGGELVFELWEKRTDNAAAAEAEHSESSSAGSRGRYYVRVLWGGQPLRSSNPSLGLIDMLPVETLLAYFDGLVGRDASLMLAKCNGSIPL